jgi:MFS family permease
MRNKFFYGYIIVSICFILQICMVGPRNSFGVFINPLTDEFGWSRALVAGSFSLSTLMLGFSSVIMGWFNDKVGPRIVTTVCGVLIGAGLILMYFVQSPWQLYLFYAILFGFGMGGVLAPLVSTINRWFISRRNIMLGLFMASGNLGGMIGPLIITALISAFNWREAFLYIGIGVSLIIVLLAQFLKHEPSQIGQVPYQTGKETRKKIVANPEELSMKQAFRTWKFWLFSVLMFCSGYCALTITVHIVPLCIDRGISADNAAVILSVLNMSMSVGSLLFGVVGERLGSRKTMIICQCLFLAVLLFLLPTGSALVLGVLAVAISMGGGGIGVLQGTIIAELFGLKSNGVILGVNFFVFTIGSSLGSFIGGFIYDSTGNYQLAFLICGILAVIALLIGIALNLIRKSQAA